MALNAAQDAALAHRANLNIAAAVVAKLGTGASDGLIGHVINEVRGSHPITELADAGGMAVVVGAVETAIARSSEADRPRNRFGADAARDAQAPGAPNQGWSGDGFGSGRYGMLQGNRGGRDGGGGESSASGYGGGSSRAAGSDHGASGTGSEPAGAAFWGTAKGMLLTRSYANDNGMNWAPPDLMKLGRPALQTLKESGLKGDGYQALRKPSGLHFGNDSILAGADYMQRRHLNHNEAAKAGAAVYEHPSMGPEDKKDWRTAIDRKNYPEGLEGDAAYAEGIRQSATRGKQKNPDMTPEYDRALKAYGADKEAGLDAKATANKDVAAAKKKMMRRLMRKVRRRMPKPPATTTQAQKWPNC